MFYLRVSDCFCLWFTFCVVVCCYLCLFLFLISLCLIYLVCLLVWVARLWFGFFEFVVLFVSAFLVLVTWLCVCFIACVLFPSYVFGFVLLLDFVV